jgi:hypothetical protein
MPLKLASFYRWGVEPVGRAGSVLGLIDMKTHQRFEPPEVRPRPA